jgi:hypothetical protein
VVNKTVSLLVAPDDLGTARIVETGRPSPAEGEVLFEVERFGLSSNNITYGLLGDRLRYWDLFPAAAVGWGLIPVWGYLRAAASSHAGVAVGRRAFGLCPMSTHLVMRPDRVDPAGFRDLAAHRVALSPVYNAYFWVDDDAADRRADDLSLVLRPLFWLSFTLDAYLADCNRGRGRVLITSASSKAACGLAHLLRQRGVTTMGMTSAAHARFVQQSGLFDQTFTYDELGSRASASKEPGVLVDIAGDPDIRQRIVDRSGPFEAVLVAGRTHSDTDSLPHDTAGGEAQIFFAPDHIRALSRDMGWAMLEHRFAAALKGYVGSATWLEVDTTHGLSGALDVYRRLVTGRSSPSAAHIIDLTEPAHRPVDQVRPGQELSEAGESPAGTST